MDMVLIICLLTLLLLGGGLILCLAASMKTPEEPQLVPFAVLPVPDAEPDTKAFLEYYAGQLAWIDSGMLRSVILIYDSPASEALCREMSRQYAFFCAMAFPEIQQLLAARMGTSIIE